jgi:ATP-dependent helicase/DNAse subunit B
MKFNIPSKYSSTIKIIVFLLGCIVLFAVNKSTPVTKYEMIEVANMSDCPLRFNFKYIEDMFETIYRRETCIRLLKDDFSKLSISDKADVVTSFILKGNLGGGPEISLNDLMDSDREELFRHMEKVPDAEIKQKFNVSDSKIVSYKRWICYRKNSLYNSDVDCSA